MIRCSSISKIMTKPRSTSAEWSETAITAMEDQVREDLFGVRKSLDDVRCIEKGRMCEDLGVELYNDVFMFDLKKMDASTRRSNGIITGEPDLVAFNSGLGVDIKVAWSLLTFPLTAEKAGKKEYEWQARGYMCLFDIPAWEIAYCAIDTPDDLLKPWDNESEHIIDKSIPKHHRITVARFERDKDIEKEMLDKCAAANIKIERMKADYIAERENYINTVKL